MFCREDPPAFQNDPRTVIRAVAVLHIRVPYFDPYDPGNDGFKPLGKLRRMLPQIFLTQGTPSFIDQIPIHKPLLFLSLRAPCSEREYCQACEDSKFHRPCRQAVHSFSKWFCSSLDNTQCSSKV